MNVYYDPEKFGLKIVGTLDFSSGSYEFDYTVVWTDGKNLYYHDDAGCSCPSPFDGVGLNDLTKTNLRDLQTHLRARREAAYNDYVSNQDIVDLVNAARKAKDKG